MPDSQDPAGLLLSCVPWRGEVKAQGCQFSGEWQARQKAPKKNAGKGETMTYKRGGVYWYKFRWSLKLQDGASENYLVRKSARTSNVKRAREMEEEHRRALRMGLVHPDRAVAQAQAPNAASSDATGVHKTVPRLRHCAEEIRHGSIL
jgi:hypothetical protein